jgi:hypothetical protein
MRDGTRTLTDDDLWALTEHVDVSAVLRAALAELRASGAAQPLGEPPDCDPVLLIADPLTGGKAELPAAAVRAIRQAGCAAAAAVDLLPPAVITAGVIGAAPDVWWHARVLCQALPAITHIAVTAAGPPPARLADHLDLAGVGLAVAADAPTAAFGANLVVAAGPAALSPEGIAAGAVLVEAVPHAYPPSLRVPTDPLADVDLPHPFHLVPPQVGCHSPGLDAFLGAALLASSR